MAVRRDMRSVLLPAIALFCASPAADAAAVEGDTVPPADAALALARTTLDSLRDKEHREETKIVWPETGEISAPADCDVLLITGNGGNVGYACVRFRRSGGGPILCQRVLLDRRWVYNLEGAYCRTQQVEVDTVRFALVWTAARLVLRASAELQTPPEGGPASHDAASGQMRSLRTTGGGVHQPYEWISLRCGAHGEARVRGCVRGTTYLNDLQDFEQLRTRATRNIFLSLTPEQNAGAAFPLREWSDYLEGGVREHLDELRLERVEVWTKVLFEVSLRLLSEVGDETAEVTAKKARERLDGANREEHLGAWLLRDEFDRSLSRMSFRLRWDPAAAAEAIHGNEHHRWVDNEHEKWVRRIFHERDFEGYRALLRADLRAADSTLVCESVAELFAYYPGEHPSDLHPLLAHEDPEVVCAAALALIGVKAPGHIVTEQAPAVAASAGGGDTRLLDAWKGIARLAADPAVPIRAEAHSHSRTARTTALNLLTDQYCPAPWRWDETRVRKQLEDPAERDARMVHDLFWRIGIRSAAFGPPPRPQPTEEQRSFVLAVWRRCLAKPFTRGTMEAIEELAALGDRNSLPRMREVLATLRAGCNRGLRWEDAGEARYPWTDRWDIDRLEKKVEALEAARATR
jgi:hypothetical protein